MTAQLLALFLGGYLVGSIPFGVLVGRACKGVDIRQYGSGNIGFSNALRVLGWKPAAVVFIADALKGAAPVVVSQALMRAWHTPHADVWLLLLGLCWQAALIGLGIWLIVVAVTRYISLASILASASVPIYMVLAHRGQAWIIFWIAIAALVILRHIPNIKRLLADAETKIGERVELREEEPDK